MPNNSMISLKKNIEFQRAYKRGMYRVSPILVTYVIKNKFGFSRFGITTSKKVGCAVQRNRSRRIIKAAFVSIISSFEIKNGYDIVFVARVKTPSVKMTDVYPVMLKHFRQLGLLNNSK